MSNSKRKNDNIAPKIEKRNIRRKIIFEDNNRQISHPNIYKNFASKSNNEAVGFLFSKGNILLVKLYSVIVNKKKSQVIFYAVKHNRWYGLNHLGESNFYIKGKIESCEQPFVNKVEIICDNGEEFNFTFIRTTLRIKEWYELHDALDVYNVFNTFPEYFKHEGLADKVFFGINARGKFLWRINDNSPLFLPELWEKMTSMISWSGMEYLNRQINIE